MVSRGSRARTAERPNAIGKVAAVLEAVSTESRLSKIAAAVELPVSTVHRILQELVEVGWVRVDEQHGYLLGARLLALGARAADGATLVRISSPILRDLRDSTGHTVHMAVRQGDEMVYLAKLDGRRAYQMRSHVGLTIPLHCTAVGKAVLARMPLDEVRALVGRTGLPRRTEHTIGRLDDLVRHLEIVRRQGYAVDEEENEAHVWCVAAAPLNPNGTAMAGLSVSSLTFDIDEARMQRHTKLVVAAAHQISSALGAPSPGLDVDHLPAGE